MKLLIEMFNINLKLLIILEIFILHNSPTVQCNCKVNVQSDSNVIPRFEKQIGETKLEANITNGRFEIDKGLKVTGFCETYFRSLDMTILRRDPIFEQMHSIELSCIKNRLFLMDYEVNAYNPLFDCVHLKWDIVYENYAHFSWCDTLSSSNLFLSAKVNSYEMILAAICFDLEEASLRVINYNVQYSQITDAEMIRNMKLKESLYYTPLLDDLQLLKTKKSLSLTNELLQQNLKDLDRLNPLVAFADLEVSSIVQGHSYAKYFKEYNDFLNIIWWRNLRLGNWKLFINTLENYAGKNSFQMFTGTSHMLELPLNLTHKQSKKLELKIDSKNLTVPAYIWSYVKSIDGGNQDFIIVGYNSPYAEFFTMDDIIFCPDICAEIPWLKDIHTSFRYTFAGIMFCCSTDFMKTTNYLDGFPTDVTDNTYNILP